MNQLNEFEKYTENIGNQIIRLIKEKKSILIVGHLNIDGIISASIIGNAIHRKNGNYIIRIYNDLNIEILKEIQEGEYDFHIFCELGSGLIKNIAELFNNKWLMLDNNQISSEEINMKQIFNSWQFNYDEIKQLSTACMAYFVAKKIDEENINLSWLAVVAMIVDQQDSVEKQSVISLNKNIINDAIKEGFLKISQDILLSGRETKPVYVALASMMTPFIPGLSGNRDACLATLVSTGLALHQNGKWRTLTDLNEDEKKKIMESVIPYLSSVNTGYDGVSSLIGNIYTLEKEDESSSLRDAREFGVLLNACGGMKRAGVGVSICLGDRSEFLHESEQILIDYRIKLSQLIQIILDDESKIVEHNTFNMIIGDGLVDEDIQGFLASILTGITKFENKVLLLRTTIIDYYIFSIRKSHKNNTSNNLGLIIHELADIYGGTGGGHEDSADCKIPSSQLKNFLLTLDKRLNNNIEN